MFRYLIRFIVTLLILSFFRTAVALEKLPAQQLTFLRRHCLDCHNAQSLEGEINLDLSQINWDSKDSLVLWERVLHVLKSGEMPPKDSSEVTAGEREEMSAWLDQTLLQHSPIGGTPARRLNQQEYRATIESLFGIKNFELPQGFPADREHHGFDNLGEGLVLSPPLLEAYAESARMVADRIFPPARELPDSEVHRAAPIDLVSSYSSSRIIDGVMRLGMKCDPIMRSCTWPARIESSVSGKFTVTVELSTFRQLPTSEPMVAKIFARDVASKDSVSHQSLRLLKEIKVTAEAPQSTSFEATLYEGQTIVVHWANAILDSDRSEKTELQEFFRNKDQRNPRYLSAWQAMLNGESGQGFRGGVGWDRVKTQLTRADLPEISDKEKEALLKKIAGNPVLYAETVVFDVFENGPALEIHSVRVEGPHELVDGPADIESRQLQEQFTSDPADPPGAIKRFLEQAFRRPADHDSVAGWRRLYEQHIASGHTPEEAMHLVIRNVLISPRFLYRCLQDGPLDNYDLATRLSFFLTGRPADKKLLQKVDRLSESNVLRAEAQRLLPSRATAPMITNFTEQWLDTRLLSEIMPDQRFRFTSNDARSAKSEVEYFFYEMLNENRPMTDFIDPDFTWTSARLAKNIYGLKGGFDVKKTNTVHRVKLVRGSRHGGILGQSAIMMATANGVDTQPVLRGVWVLENILGTPPPPPPKSVPPITPDTTGAKTPRDLLTLHTSQTSCAGCHHRIDPVGFVLENFDPVGRWRDNWPEIEQPIDAAATLPDGTQVDSVVDFKAWLVRNIDQFSECLAGKLMTYATGRVLNYSERKEIATIVKNNHDSGNGFRDLLLALIDSQTFRTK